MNPDVGSCHGVTTKERKVNKASVRFHMNVIQIDTKRNKTPKARNNIKHKQFCKYHTAIISNQGINLAHTQKH